MRKKMRGIAVLVGIFGAIACAVAMAENNSSQSPSVVTTWKINFDESGSSPVIVDDVLYIGSAGGAVYAIDSKSGKIKWRFQTGENIKTDKTDIQATSLVGVFDALEKQRKAGSRRIDMTPAVDNGAVLVGSGDKSFYAIDAETGQKRWDYPAGLGMASFNNTSYSVPAPIIKKSIVYFVTEEGLHALDILTGRKKWLFETLQEIPIRQMNGGTKRTPSAPVMGDDVILLTAWPLILGDSTPKKSFVYAVDPESGKAKWVTSLDGLDITAPLTAKGMVFAAVEEPKKSFIDNQNHVALYAISSADGQIKWKTGLERNLYGTPVLQITNNSIYFSTNINLQALDIETGRQLWNLSAETIGGGFYKGGYLSADDQHLYVVTHKESMFGAKNTLHSLTLSNGQEVWSKTFSETITVAFSHDGTILIDGKHLYAIDAATGKEKWSFKDNGIESARLIFGNRIFLTSPTRNYVGNQKVDQGYLYAIDAKTGKLKQ